jgi:hypothetical protein
MTDDTLHRRNRTLFAHFTAGAGACQMRRSSEAAKRPRTRPVRRLDRLLPVYGDLSAVKAALRLPWTTNPAEGQIKLLKMLRRAMYGRAGFGRLHARVPRNATTARNLREDRKGTPFVADYMKSRRLRFFGWWLITPRRRAQSRSSLAAAHRRSRRAACVTAARRSPYRPRSWRVSSRCRSRRIPGAGWSIRPKPHGGTIA